MIFLLGFVENNFHTEPKFSIFPFAIFLFFFDWMLWVRTHAPALKNTSKPCSITDFTLNWNVQNVHMMLYTGTLRACYLDIKFDLKKIVTAGWLLTGFHLLFCKVLISLCKMLWDAVIWSHEHKNQKIIFSHLRLR